MTRRTLVPALCRFALCGARASNADEPTTELTVDPSSVET